jgi:ribosomal protein S18 acetylase RimI-like enzyme
MDIEEFDIADYEQVYSLWSADEGIGLHDVEDSRDGIALFLQRNPDLSFVARERKRIVGAILCGHDGRRGYLQHLIVDPEYRQRGIGRSLVNKVLLELNRIGIRKCNLVVYRDNKGGQKFWEKIGWLKRYDLLSMQSETKGQV